MNQVVNDNYPGSQPLTDTELKEKFLAQTVNTGATVESGVPTEVISLPSRGYFYPEGHPLSSGQIEMKYMTAKEEDILASPNLIKQGVVIDKLLQSLIVTKINFNDLLTIDKNAVFIAARMLAYGNDYEVDITCPKCNEKSKHTIDLGQFEEKVIDWNLFTKGNTTFEYTLPKAGKNKLTLKFATHGDEKLIEEDIKASKKLSKITGIDTELTTRLKHTIVSVDGNTDKAFINKFVDSMLSVNSLALRKYLKQITPDVDTTFTFTCPHCQHEQDKMQLPIGLSFFWPSL